MRDPGPAEMSQTDAPAIRIAHAATDPATAEWLTALRGAGRSREAAVERLHGLLVRVARTELARRAAQHRLLGPELDDLAHQAAADALVAVLAKLEAFRGESRFTTWAYKFVVLEVAGKLARHFWHRHPAALLDTEDWERLPDRFGVRPDEHVVRSELFEAVRTVLSTRLTDRQRSVFHAVVVQQIPVDAFAERTGSTRGAVYKAMFDARLALRAALVEGGHLDPTGAAAGDSTTGGKAMGGRKRRTDGRAALESFLHTDPADVGCDRAIDILHHYADLVLDPELGRTRDDRVRAAADRYPGVAAHLAACGPCSEDFHGLLSAVQADLFRAGRRG